MPTKLPKAPKYQHIQDNLNVNAPMICGASGVRKKYSELTDEDVALAIQKGSKAFQAVPPETVAAKPA